MAIKSEPVRGTTRLTIMINDELYDVRPPKEGVLKIIKKRDKTKYTVRLMDSGEYCSCPDYAKRDRPGGCKHIRALSLWFR